MVTVTMPTEIPEYSVAPVTVWLSVTVGSCTESVSFSAVTSTGFGLDQSLGVNVTLVALRLSSAPDGLFPTDTVTFAEGGLFRTTV